MKDSSKTKQALTEELASLRRRVGELEQSEVERKKIEGTLRESEGRLNALYQESPIPTFTWQKRRDDFFLVDFNRAAVRITDGKAHNFLGKNADELYQYQPQVLDDMRRCFTEHSVIRRDILSKHFAPGKSLSVHYAFIPPDLIIVHTEDQTDRRRMEEKLRESEEKYSSLFENSIDAVLLTAPDGSILVANPEACRIFGRTEKEICRIGSAGLMDLTDPRLVAALDKRDCTGQFRGELTFIRKDGIPFPGEISSVIFRDRDGNSKTSMMIRDITERKRAEEALRDTEMRYRMLFEHSPDGIVIIDPATACPLEFNETAHRQLGYSREEFADLSIFDLEVDETSEETRSRIAQVIHEGRVDFETRQHTRQGEIRNVHVTAQIIDISGKQVYHCIWRDITDRKRAEESLTKSEEKFRKAFYTSPDSVNINRLEDGMYISINPGFTKITGYKEEDIIGKTSIEYKIWENIEDRQRLVAGLRKDGVVTNLEAAFRTKGGEIRHGLMSASIIDFDGVLHILSITRDITDRKRVEEALTESEEHYRSLFENMLNGFAYCRMLFDGDRPLDFIYLDVNNAFETLTGLKNVVGKKASDAIPGIRESDAALFESYGRVAMTGKSEQFEKYVKAMQMWFSVSVYSPKKEYFVAVFDVITKRKWAEEQLQNTLESLRKAVGTTIQVMVSAVETRDPYTSGHQTRSAGLACAIATEMGLPQDTIEGIRMASSIHDIGKLSIPAEILSKPTKLSEIEFSLIKEHARQGYEILKDVESPWPLAEIVHQHHERMDGSGYPRKLKGDDILMEARILAVADVVEAMASHRPYRPGLGIDAALNEIEKNRGIFYDSAVADACLRLFREKGFKLEGT